jgi:hypothetical protein
MDRPLARLRRRDFALLGAAFATLLGAKGCDSNYIGVQDYGSVIGNVVDQAGKPIPDAFVRITGTTTTSTTGPMGAFSIVHVAVGEQTITAYAAGYDGQATADVIIIKDKTASAGNLKLLATTAPQHLMQQTPAPLPVPTGT